MSQVVALLFAFFTALSLQAQQIMKVEIVSENTIVRPTLMTFCGEHLWVYGHGRREIIEIAENLKGESRILNRYELGHQGFKHLSALGCLDSQLIGAFYTSAQKDNYFYGFIKTQSNSIMMFQAVKPSPAKARITELNCENEKCVMITEGRVFTSSRMANWKELDVPLSSKLEPLESHKDINPFDNWQDTLTITKGRYTKAVFTKSGLALLDPFRSTVSVLKDNEWKKWGAWGVWEGQMLSPKAMTLLSGSAVLISDVGLKALFIFNLEGHYLASLGVDVAEEKNQAVTPDMALSLAAKGDAIVVADYEKNRVTVYKVKVQNLPEKSKDFIRVNLFRRAEVLKDAVSHRCLKCHDGTITDSLDKVAGTKANHPVHIEFKGKTDLMLEQDNQLTCATCHNPHHGAVVKTKQEEQQPQNHPPFLRKEWRALCLSCHSDHTGVPNNHPDKEGKACITCHLVHGGANKLLRQEVPGLCLSCHANKKGEHRVVENFLDTERAKGVHFEDGTISCMTCHAQHGKGLESKLRVSTEKVMPFCATCHGQKTEALYKNFHARIRKRGK